MEAVSARAVAVVLPGIGGSSLAVDGQAAWPGTPAEYVGGLTEGRFARLLSDAAVPGGVLPDLAGVAAYAPLLATLRALGFTPDGRQRTLLPFAYDWRRSVTQSAAALADRLDKETARDPADFFLIAHSLGGLVARHLLEDRAFAGRPGRAGVRLLVTIGTPHRGAPAVLAPILGARGFGFMNGAKVRALTADPRFPAAYDLLPPPGDPFLWQGRPGADRQALDPYAQPAVARMLRLDSTHLAGAAAAWATLMHDWAAPTPAHGPAYCALAGTQQPTLDRWLLAPGGLEPGYSPAAGDGRVPVRSAAPDGSERHLLAGSHDDLVEDPAVGVMLAALLPVPAGIVPPAFPPLRLSLPASSVIPGEPVRVTLLAAGGGGIPGGTLRLTPESVPDATPAARAVAHAVPRVGDAALHLDLPPLASPGAWRVSFETADAPAPGSRRLYGTTS